MTSRATLLGLTLTALWPAAGAAQTRVIRPDPPARATVWPADLKLKLRTWRDAETFVFAGQDGPFAAIGGWDNPWTIHDLRTGKKVGEVSQKVIRQNAVLSRDGTRLAGYVPDDRFGFAAVVAETATGRIICRTLIRARPFESAFAGRDRIVELFRISSPNKDCGVKFLDVKEQTEGTLLPGKVTLPPVVSPGGRYVALATAERITLLSVADDDVAGRLALPVAAELSPEQPESFRRFTAVALAFSPDGTKLGGVFRHAIAGYRVFWWRLDDGVLVEGFRLPRPVVEGQSFQWSADGAAMLVGYEDVLDATTGKELWKLPSTKTSANRNRRLLSADRALSVESGKAKSNDFRLVIRSRP
jgi:hypothetical protein